MRKYSSHASRKRKDHLHEIRQLVGLSMAREASVKQILPNKHEDLQFTNGMLFTFSVLVTGMSYTSSSEFCTYMGIECPSQNTFYKCQKRFSLCVDKLLNQRMTAYQKEVLKRKKMLLSV